MSPDEQPVSVREFERTHAELREDINAMKAENAADHAAVVAKLEELRSGLSRVVTWPQLAVIAPLVLAAIALIVKS